MGENIAFFDATTASVPGKAEGNHLDGRAIPVGSLAGFNAELVKLKNAGVKMSKMVIVSHGQPGAAWIGGDPLTDQTAAAVFGAQGFAILFERDGRIFFKGCNVAAVDPDDQNGRDLLSVMARIFLSIGGGRASAGDGFFFNIGLGNIGIPIGTRMFNFNGNVVHALINPGGTRLRIGVGPERSTPVAIGDRDGDTGVWRVQINNQNYGYGFDKPNLVKWSGQGSAFGFKTGNGTWQRVGDVLKLTWDSGSIEEWDLPLFELEQTGTGKFSDGRPYTVQASLQTPLNSL